MKIFITLVVALLGVLFVLAAYNFGTQGNQPPAAQSQTEPQTPATASDDTAAPAPRTAPASASAPAPKTTPTPNVLVNTAASPTPEELITFNGLKAASAETYEQITLGSTDPDAGYLIKMQLNSWGSGIESVELSDYFQTWKKQTPYTVIKPLRAGPYDMITFDARWVKINGQFVDLERPRAKWRVVEKSPARAVLALDIVDAANQGILRIERTYQLAKNSYDIFCGQRMINLTDTPLQVQWSQYGQGDIVVDLASYMGDRRLFVAGYFNLEYDPKRLHVYIQGTYQMRSTVVKDWDTKQVPYWPNADAPSRSELVWLASLNRYFAVAAHAIPQLQTPAPGSAPGSGSESDTRADADQAEEHKLPATAPPLETLFPTIGIVTIGEKQGDYSPTDRAMLFTFTSKPTMLAPGAGEQLDLGLYVGPRKKKVFEQQPFALLQLGNLVRYELGCTWCTFQWLAKGLLDYLKLLHAIFFDWALAIILLVVTVRLILHPITKKSQINMQKMQKQMAALQPEKEKIEKKYPDDKTKQQQEMMKLYREKGVNPANMLGCLPMFLQMPIWVALYAMLYYAIELRHEAGFYGIFQAISGGRWPFLADLSVADRFIPLFDTRHVINLGLISFDYSSINILPILMAAVFYVQQKIMAPPAANDQARQQQKIMGFMVLLFPVMLYSAPSGLTLYIMASTAAGIVDSYIVRKHIKQQEADGTLFQAKPRKTGGFMDRMNKAMEEKQRQIEAKKKNPQRGPKGRGKGQSR